MNHPLIEPLEARIAPATFSIATPGGIVEGNSGTTDLLFTVTLTDAITSNATVHFTTVNGTTSGSQATTADGDYTLTTGTLTFVPGGPTEQIVRVPITGDTKREPDELFSVMLDMPTGATLDPTKTTAVGTILNDDPIPTVSIGNATFAEGDAGTKTVTFDVTLSNRTSSNVSVKVSTADLTATAGSDYVSITTQTVNFLALAPSLTRQVSVTINGDTTMEPDETFKVLLSEPSAGVTIGTGEGIGTITNDDVPPTISIDGGTLNVAAAEGNAGSKSMNFTVKLSKAFTEVVTVTAATTAGSATVGNDFTAVSQLLTFAAGETTKIFSVPVSGDLEDEADETFTVNLTGPSANATLGTATQAVGTILNDEVQISAGDVSFVETNGDATLTFNVTLSQAANHPVSVNFTTQDGTAVSTGAGRDFDLAAGTLTFAPGQIMLPVNVTIRGDSIGELDENFFLKLTGASGAVLARDTATATLLNDEAALSIGNAQVLEGGVGGVTQAVFTVTLVNGPQTGNVTVNYATADGTAMVAGSDYTAAANTLTFMPGETTRQVMVVIAGDATAEENETFSVVLSGESANAGIAMGTGTGTILNDDGSALTINDVTVTEGDAGTSNAVFLVRMLNAATSAVTVDVTTEAGTASTADFSALTQTLTFAAGETQKLVTVPITGDLLREGTESFVVRLANATGGATIAKATGTGTILDNGDPAVTVRVGDVSLAEGANGTTIFNFTVSLNPQGGGELTETVTVNFATADGTATSSGTNQDFTASSGVLTFPAGGGLTQTVSISVSGDGRLENNETFFLNLLSATNAGIADNQGAGTITNDDAVQISIGDASLTEGNSGTGNMSFAVTLTGSSDVPVTVRVDTEDGTALGSATGALNDFTKLTNSTVTFAPGETSKTVTVAVVGDATQEATTESFTVKLSAPTPSAVTLADATGTGTITDNDLPTLSVGNVTLIEGNAGTVEADFTVTLSGVSTVEVGFTYATADSTATAGTDYVAVSGTGTIAAGQTTALIKVLVNGDTASEVNERFLFNLLTATNASVSMAGQATATIVDDDAGGARVQLVPVNGDTFDEEDRVVEFNVVRTGDLSRAVSVQYETLDDTAQSFGTVADFVAKSGRVSFAAGSTTASETIRVRIVGDANYENAETFQVRLFNAVNASVLDDLGNVVIESETDVTITDDPADLAPMLSVADVQIVEGDAGSQQVAFKVRLVNASGQLVSNEKQAVTVRATTAAGSDAAMRANSAAATAALVQDFVATEAGGRLITFDEGDTEKDFLVTVNGDLRDEIDEEFFKVLLSGETGATILRGEALGTIADNDAAPTLTLSGPATAPVEGDFGITTATYKVTLSQVSERSLSVQATTNPITAISSGTQADFQALDHLVVTQSTPGATFEFTVLVNGDTVDEANETFGVTLSDAVNGTLAGGTASVTTTIVDNDPVPVILVGDTSILEGNAGTTELVFMVSLSGESGQTVDVNFATQDGTGLGGATSSGPMADFVAKTGALKFAPGETQKEVRVTINSDTFKERNETFSLLLSGAVNGTILTGAASGIGTIVSDGDTTVGIAVRDAFGVEGASGTTTISFTVELSDALTTATTFGAVTTSGTAVRGSDFVALGNEVFTIAANTKTATVPVTVNGDGAFEATESFFVGLRNVLNAGGETVTISGGAARGTIFNDDLRRVNAQTIQFIDVDGDLATVHVSKGVLNSSRLSFGNANAVGGRQLQIINLTGNNTQFQNANLAVTAVTQAGFNGDANGVKGDGLVNVGAIFAAIVQPGILQFVNGIDLNNVTIDGDLGKIHVGDTGATSALKNLVVRSMGKFGTSTQAAATANNTPDLISFVLGPIDNFHVLGNFQSTLQVIGAQFGIIRNLQIDGALLGGTAANSGEIFFTGRIGDAQIGRIVGGAGEASGSLIGSSSTGARIVNLRVTGDVRGGGGENSGVVSAPSIGTVRVGAIIGGAGQISGNVLAGSLDSIVVTRNVIGGDGSESGQIFANGVLGSARVFGEIRGGEGERSGVIGSSVRIGNAFVFGAIFGGEGASSGGVQADGAISEIRTGALVGGIGTDSGTIRAGGNVQKLTVNGNILGGTGAGSGGVDVSGKLVNGLVAGNVVGGDSTATSALVKSGFVTAHRIQTLTVAGDLKSGVDGGAGLASSGTIRSETTIATLRIRGDVTGSADVAAIISAPGDTSGAAIQTLIIGGNATFAEILGGYSANATTVLPRGLAANSDAQIGTIAIGGNLLSTSIVAGVAAGTDGLFGTADDFAIGGAGTTNAARTLSKIARIIIGGNVLAGSVASGIEAQYVQTVTVRGSAFPLQSGPGNDGAPGRELAAGSQVRVFEVPVV